MHKDGMSSRLIDRLDEIRAAISDVAFEVQPGEVLDLLNAAKDRLGMAQDLIEANE